MIQEIIVWLLVGFILIATAIVIVLILTKRRSECFKEKPIDFKDIRKMFQDSGGIACMKPLGLDLGDETSVKNNIGKIISKLESGEMPPDKPWEKSKIEKLKSWASQ